ncbi:hypothetical protein SSX86_026234 [Deinandra increscens subsp. villosa]|uniref:WD repeat-containing protein 76 n=1 Tax=Deinandra increscens subsp. villosa TaxID=3103831 RepID=A0AAP0GNS7_9ASTR
MATQRLTDYERKRIENIKRNEDLLASLNIKSKLSDLSASAKRHRSLDLSIICINIYMPETKSYKVSPEKKARSETPIVIRRSLRTQGKAPDSAGLKDDFSEPPKKSTTLKSQITTNKSPRELVPISMRDANTCSESDETLVNTILSVYKEPRLKDDDDDDDGDKKFRVRASIDLGSMELAPENVARVVPNRILSVKFFPSADLKMVVVGNKFGNLGFWNVDSEKEDGDGIYMYHPHPAPVSSILIHPFSLNKIITSCYGVSMLDERSSSRSSFSWELHDSRINTIDFNSENTNMMATSSSDGTACIWDLRKLGKSKPKSLMVITRERAVHSAYFSPSGSSLATTSLDDKIGVLSGPNYEDEFIINHNNQTGRWLSTFKGVWGWDDSYVFVGNMKRGVDVISTEQKRLVTTMESPHMTAIPCRFDPHPLNPGMLAGATSGGQVYIWSS